MKHIGERDIKELTVNFLIMKYIQLCYYNIYWIHLHDSQIYVIILFSYYT